MSENNNAVFGAVNDQDTSLQSKAGGKFGLNTNARVSKLEYNPNGGTDNAAADVVDITVQIGEREFRERVFDVTKVFDNKGHSLTPGTDEYKKKYNVEINQRMAAITHIVKSVGVTQDSINAAFATPANNWKQWIEIMMGLLPTDFNTKPVDVFLEYQWTIGANNDKTYLILPKNMKGGYFIAPMVPCTGEWTVAEGESLKYVDSVGKEHPFTKSADYMASNKANQQFEGGDAAAIEGQPAPTAAGGGNW